MERLDCVALSREMARLARGAKEQAGSPEMSARERKLLRRQARAAEECMRLYALAGGARSDYEATRLLKRALRHQAVLTAVSDGLASITRAEES